MAKEVLAQFPEFVGLMKSSLTEYKEMLDTIVSSDVQHDGRKYIHEIKIYEDRFKVCFKAGIELDIPR